MSKKALLHDRGAKKPSFDIIECENAPVAIAGQYVRDLSRPEGKRKIKIDEFDPKNEDHSVYVMIDVDHQNYKSVKKADGTITPRQQLHIEVGELNLIKGFRNAIDIEGHEWAFKNGAKLTAAGETIMFTVS